MRFHTFLPALTFLSSSTAAGISPPIALSTVTTGISASTTSSDVKAMVPRGKPGGVNDSNCPEGTTFVPHDIGGFLLGWGCHRKWMKHKQCCRKDEGRRYICDKGWQKNCKPPLADRVMEDIERAGIEEMNEGEDDRNDEVAAEEEEIV